MIIETIRQNIDELLTQQAQLHYQAKLALKSSPTPAPLTESLIAQLTQLKSQAEQYSLELTESSFIKGKVHEGDRLIYLSQL